ncbi:MAG: hypothetical protein E2576_14360 [Alcaligenaceae bacterium]|nr:hypothetical protein [Alcaligenaceae bacterium SAGV5]MPS50437.1 hypothetical protein [Alcaligenaceae bacterium SAGV3]MPT57902.1 hypothetical protein [Alcaligenaceae bacterium]
MKYAHEVLELFQAYPDRSFRVMEVVRYAAGGRCRDPREREAARRAVHRVLAALLRNGTVVVSQPAQTNGGFALYSVSRYRDTEPPKACREA